MPEKSREQRRKKVIEVLNQARAMELHAIHQYMNQHCNYFDNVDGHIADPGDTYPAKIAGTPSATGLTPKGFTVGAGGA